MNPIGYLEPPLFCSFSALDDTEWSVHIKPINGQRLNMGHPPMCIAVMYAANSVEQLQDRICARHWIFGYKNTGFFQQIGGSKCQQHCCAHDSIDLLLITPGSALPACHFGNPCAHRMSAAPGGSPEHGDDPTGEDGSLIIGVEIMACCQLQRFQVVACNKASILDDYKQ